MHPLLPNDQFYVQCTWAEVGSSRIIMHDRIVRLPKGLFREDYAPLMLPPAVDAAAPCIAAEARVVMSVLSAKAHRPVRMPADFKAALLARKGEFDGWLHEAGADGVPLLPDA